MGWVRVVAARLRGLLSGRRAERELDAEVRFHIEMQTDANVEAGMNPADARLAARRAFGGAQQIKEQYRERRGIPFLETLGRDFRFGVRSLWKSPGFTATAVVTLGLALGANTAMFSVIDAVLLRPLPYPDPGRLTMLWSEAPGAGALEARTAYWDVEQWRRLSHSFAGLAVADTASVFVTAGEETEKVRAMRISPNTIQMLGLRVMHGRMFTEEEAAQRQRLGLLGHQYWQSRFGGSFDAIGSTITMEGTPVKIIGIMPPDESERLGANCDVWEPHTAAPGFDRQRGLGVWFVIGRLNPGVSLAQAQEEMSAIAGRLDADAPLPNRRRGITIVPLQDHVTGSRTRLSLWLLAGAVFCVLLIAATNVAGLALARGASREREMAVRTALGASRARIALQLAVEGAVLGLVSGAVGLYTAHAGLQLVLAAGAARVERITGAGLDLRVICFAESMCLLTGILAGLAPVLTIGRRSIGSGRGVAGGLSISRLRRVLVMAEFAMAIVLLTGAGLLIRSLRAVEQVDLGFRPERTLMIAIARPVTAPSTQWAAVYDRVIARVQSIPGVESASIVSDLFYGGNPERSIITDGGSTIDRVRLRSDEASHGVFRTIGAPLLAGRLFNDSDNADAPPVAIVNDSFARRVWAGTEPLGRRFRLTPGAPWITVVGVIGNMRRQGLELEPAAQMFVPMQQQPSRLAVLLVRTAAEDPLPLAGLVRAAVRDAEKQMPVYGVQLLEERLGEFSARRRFQTVLLAAFAAVALLLAAIGIYGLIRYSIAMRTNEIGVRMALGAEAGSIFRMVLGEGLRLGLTGTAIGLAGALLLGRAGASLLYGVHPADPLTIASVSLLLTGVAAGACFFPARRAMRVEPVAALRQDS